MKNYFSLAAPEIRNAEVDFSPIANALEDYRNRARQAQQDKLAAQDRQNQLGRQAQQDARQAKSDELATVERLGKMALAYDQLTDPAQRQAGLNKIISMHPNAGSLTNEYRDPNQAFKLIAAEAGQFVDPYQKQKQQIELENTKADTEYKKAQAAKNYQEASMGSVPKLTATDKKAIDEANEMVTANQSAIENLTYAKDLSKKSNQGMFAKERATIANNIPFPDFLSSPESAQNTVLLDNTVTSNALQQLKAIFGGMPTEGERKILLEIQGSVNQPDSVRQAIYDRAITLAKQRLEFNKNKLNELRGGTYYKERPPVQNASVSQSSDLKSKYGLE